MPKNEYFNQGWYEPEQELLRSLSQEVVSIHGINVEWIHNPYTNVDSLYKEDRLPELGEAKTLVVLPANALNGVDGEALYSKFGFLNQQTIDIQISEKEWKEIFNTVRPLEGDIFYVKKFDQYGPADLWKVTYIDRENPVGWFPLGKHHAFGVTAEKWAYSGEDFSNTGFDELDNQHADWSNDVDVNPNFESDKGSQNEVIGDVAAPFVNWDERHPFGGN